MPERWTEHQVEVDPVLADAAQLALHGTPMAVLLGDEDVAVVARALDGRGSCEVRPDSAAPPGRLIVNSLQVPGGNAYMAVTWQADAPDLWGHVECRRSLCTPEHARELAARLREHAG
jgi:hypothetical protein